MLSLHFAIFAISMSTFDVKSEQIKQCLCSEMEPCMEIYGTSLMPCIKSCESEASDIGADVDELKQCLHKLEPHFKTTMECVKNTHFDVCANETREDVPKRYPETIKMSADVEVKNTLSKPNVPYDVKKFLVTGRKLRQCVHSCIDRRANECLQKAKCALDHPSDPKIVEKTRECGLHTGLNSQLAREVCHCVRDSGVKDLQNVCETINDQQ